METQITIKDIKGVIRRRKKSCLVTFCVIFIMAVIVALALPPVYRSQSLIMIEEQQIPEDYVKTTITSYAQERMEMITRQIMSFSSLEKIITEHNLYPEYVSRDDMGTAIKEMKESIELEPISFNVGNTSSVGKTTSATMAFQLSYSGKKPQTVQTVTNLLAKLYLAEEEKARQKLVNVTSDFLQEELKSLRLQIQEHEARISDFKAAHLGELPENSAANLQTESRLEHEIEGLESRSRTLQDKILYLKGQMATVEPLTPVQTEEGTLTRNPKERLKSLRLTLLSMQSRLSDKHPDIRKVQNEIKKLEMQVGSSDEAVEKIQLLDDKKAELAALQSKYGPKHPDVIKLQKQVEILTQEVKKLSAQKTAFDVSEEQPDNPVYINLKTQLVSAQSELESLKEDKQKLEAELTDYRAKIERSPSIEKEYNDLTMDYANAKQKYNEILSQLMEANVAKGMEEQQKGEHFAIIEPAYLPLKPYKPNRIAIILLGVVLASSVGVSLAALQEGLDHTIKSEDQLSQITGIPVLSALSMMESTEERKLRAIKNILWGVGALSTVTFVLIIVNRFIIPLEELLNIIQSRM